MTWNPLHIHNDQEVNIIEMRYDIEQNDQWTYGSQP